MSGFDLNLDLITHCSINSKSLTLINYGVNVTFIGSFKLDIVYEGFSIIGQYLDQDISDR